MAFAQGDSFFAGPSLDLAIAVVSSYLSSTSFSIELSLPADALCWALITACYRIAPRLILAPAPESSPRLLMRARAGVLAAALIGVAVCDALADVHWIIVRETDSLHFSLKYNIFHSLTFVLLTLQVDGE